MSSSRLADAASAANRFGLGARPGAIEAMHDPRGALAQQARTPPSNDVLFAGLTRSADYLVAENRYQLERRERRQERVAAKDAGANGANAANADPVKEAIGGFRQQFGDQLLAEGRARWHAALTAPIGFDERIVRFWSNQFAVSVDKRQALLYAAPMEREVIRPLAFGRFADLLLGVETHPAMLRYLDNAASIGPDSRAGERAAQLGGGAQQPKRRLGLNENLAREILELHTLGVNGGYTQADVTEFARAITGWSVRAPRDDRGGGPLASSYANGATGFVYRDNAHEPGARTILGKRYAEGGMEQGRAVLADLAIHPATAKHLSLKLARHFVSDQPPPKLLQRMAVAYLDSGGDLRALYSTLLDSDEAWAPEARKFRAPDDFLVASLRALGIEQVPDGRKLAGLLARLGRPDFQPRSPAGFADTADAWIGPDALWKRIQAAEELATRASHSLVPAQVARDALGPRLGAGTAQAIARADSPQQALSLLFGSPDFQWRI
ncbi:MAG TPA: DUF1800 domain-containing protein [Xanthomonadaceae bacterium]